MAMQCLSHNPISQKIRAKCHTDRCMCLPPSLGVAVCAVKHLRHVNVLVIYVPAIGTHTFSILKNQYFRGVHDVPRGKDCAGIFRPLLRPLPSPDPALDCLPKYSATLIYFCNCAPAGHWRHVNNFKCHIYCSFCGNVNNVKHSFLLSPGPFP